MTRPTVALTKSEDGVEEETVDDIDNFFSPLATRPLATAASNMVNGEMEKGWVRELLVDIFLSFLFLIDR